MELGVDAGSEKFTDLVVMSAGFSLHVVTALERKLREDLRKNG